jgi:lysophospholipase L1-like esterase
MKGRTPLVNVVPRAPSAGWHRPLWVLCLALALSGFAHGQGGFRSAQPAPRLEYWQQRVLTIEQELAAKDTVERARLLFLGDSITDFWLLGNSPWHKNVRYGRAVWDESFGASAGANRAVNLAVSGDRTEHVLHRVRARAGGGLGHLDGKNLNPEFVILLIGINNSWMAEEPVVDSVTAGIEAVVDAVHRHLPRARIVLQTLLPTGEAERNERVVQPVNRRVLSWASSPRHASYLSVFDLHAVFVDRTGKQIADHFVDGLHPNESGYRAWRDGLVRHLAEERARLPR